MDTFFRRYLKASDKLNEKCQSMYPWISTCARTREKDGSFLRWIVENGQTCPGCSTGVECIEGAAFTCGVPRCFFVTNVGRGPFRHIAGHIIQVD